MPATLKDVAERSGLSLQTVSRILNGRGEMHNEVTRERVLRVANEIGYRPNSSARAMRRGRFGNIALLLSENPVLSLLPEERREGILDVLGERELNLLIARCSDTKLTNEAQMPRILREMMADGLLINYNAQFPPMMSELIEQHRLPAIWLNSRQTADCVFPDDQDGGEKGTQHLLQMGHRRIIFLTHVQASHYSYRDRVAGYERAMRLAGLMPQVHSTDVEGADPEAVTKFARFFQGDSQPTAFITYSAETANFLLFAAATKGRTAPRDFSLVTFHTQLLYTPGVAIDTMVLPERAMGQLATQKLLEKIENPKEVQPPVALPLTLMRGTTCATPGDALPGERR
jgi:LacI family transcriptional regulator